MWESVLVIVSANRLEIQKVEPTDEMMVARWVSGMVALAYLMDDELARWQAASMVARMADSPDNVTDAMMVVELVEK